MKRLAVLTLLAGASLVPVKAANIILNPGFEAGDFTSWNFNHAATGSELLVQGQTVKTGIAAAAFAGTTPGDYDTLAQSFTTVNGQSYTFSFFLAGIFFTGGELAASESVRGATVAVDPVGDFQAFWDGQMVLDSPAGNRTGFNDFPQFSFNELGTGSDIITFKGYNVPTAYILDDVSVTTTSATPEPATWAVMAAGLVAVGAFRRITR